MTEAPPSALQDGLISPTMPAVARLTALASLRRHWPEYLMECWGVGFLVLVSAVLAVMFDALMQPIAIAGPDARRLTEGVIIGLAGIGLVYSRWGRQSGAHFNPAVTATFFALGKVKKWDAAFYAAAHIAGGIIGLLLAALILGQQFRNPPVAWTLAMPGGFGQGAAFLAEFAAAFTLISLILVLGGRPRLAPFVGVADGIMSLVFTAIVAPISGYSLNPARSLAAALVSGQWGALWIYLLAPPSGMLAAAAVNRHLFRARPMPCAKLRHEASVRCIHCGFVPAAKPGRRLVADAPDSRPA
jgi:aquaporin Z